MKIRRFRWLIATLLFVATALSFFDRQVLSVLVPVIRSDVPMDNVAYSWILFAYLLSYSVMFTVGGRLIDRLGTRRGLALSVGLWSLASLLHSTAHNAVQLGFLRFFLGFGEGGCFPGAAKGVLEWFPKKERAIAMGFATVGGSAIGATIAPPAIAWVALYVGWRGAFLLTGVVGALWLVGWFRMYSLPGNSRFVSDAERQYIMQDGDRCPEPRRIPPATPWSEFFKSKEVRGLVTARLLFDPVLYFYMFWIPRYLSEVRGASLQRIGQWSWIPFLTLGISSVLGGWVSDRLVLRGVTIDKARKAILLAAALLTPVSIMAVFVQRVETAILLMSVLMFAHGLWITNYMTMIGDLFPSRDVGTVVGLTGTAGGIGGFLSSLVIGKVVESVSYTPVFIAVGVTYPICVIILLLAIKQIRPIELTPRQGLTTAEL